MPDRLYNGGRNRFARGEILWRAQGGSIVCAFLLDGKLYAPDTVRHQFLSDIPAAARKGTGGDGSRMSAPALVCLDPEAGVCDAEDVTFRGIPADCPRLDYLVLFADTGADETSPLIAFFEDSRGLPFVPSGADVQVVWGNGVNRIFRL